MKKTNNNNYNLIIGTAWEYNLDEMNIFVQSWKKYCRNTELFMILSPRTEKKTIDWLSSFGIKTFMFAGGMYTPAKINYSRYFKYYDILYEHSKNIKNVFLTDVRDVVFQGNIFEHIRSPGLHCFLEDKSKKIGENYFDRSSVEIQYGNDTLQEIANLPIICSGTTLGDYNSIIQYVVHMLEQRQLKQILKDHMFNIDCPGIDQAMHMYILHKNIIKNIKHENGDGVSTLALTEENNIHILPNNKISIYNNKISPVVHQWDRHLSIKNHLEKIYNS